MIGLVGIFLLALVFASPTESFCSDHKTGCGLITGFVSTTLVAIAGYFFVVVWSLRKALPGYRNVVKHTPERLLPAAGRIRLDDIITRPQLADTIINELEPSRMAAPGLVVGAAGTGKTTFLLELASRLADTHVMPVLCVLRGTEPPLRLRDMARTQFIDAIDPLVRSQEHAERVWRRLCGAGEVVLLADGLDEFMPGAPLTIAIRRFARPSQRRGTSVCRSCSRHGRRPSRWGHMSRRSSWIPCRRQTPFDSSRTAFRRAAERTRVHCMSWPNWVGRARTTSTSSQGSCGPVALRGRRPARARSASSGFWTTGWI